MATLTEVFPCFFLGCKANARVKTAKTGHGPHSSKIFVLFYIYFVLFYVLFVCGVLCIVGECMCTVRLPPGGYPIAVNKYILLYHFIYTHIRYTLLILFSVLRHINGRTIRCLACGSCALFGAVPQSF